MKASKLKHQANQYDKVFKENIEAVMLSLMQKMLGIIAVDFEKLPDDIQYTKERKADFLNKITDNKGDIFVLHIEFQVVDEPEMVDRMAEYYIMLRRKYRLPIKQFVIFIGSGKPKMVSRIDSDFMKYWFPLISILDFDYRIFLNSTRPEEIILAILANFEQETPENAMKQIINRIEETTEGDFLLKRYFKQLRVLAQLRNLEENLKETIMLSISKYLDETRDVGYMIGFDKGEQQGEQKGELKGEQKAKENFVKNLLAKMSLTFEQIADIAGVSVEFVQNVKKKDK